MNREILVLVKYTVKPGKREEFLKKAETLGIIRDSKAEPGNRKYEYALPLKGENDLLLTEIWADASAQAQHGETAHYQKLQALKQEYVTRVAIEKYGIEKL